MNDENYHSSSESYLKIDDFFKSFILTNTFNENFIPDTNFKKITEEIFSKQIFISQQFQKIGYFSFKSQEEHFFEIHDR